MNVYTTEEEQVRQIKSWLKSYGKPIIIGIIIALIVVFGWRYWQDKTAITTYRASSNYEQMQASLATGQIDEAKTKAQNLIADYASTPYAKLAALALARIAVEQEDLTTAQSQLQWVIKRSSDPAMKQIARMRLARVSLAEDKPQDAITALSTVDEPQYLAEIEVIRADAYVAMEQNDKARQAYDNALSKIAPDSSLRPLIQMLRNDIALPNN